MREEEAIAMSENHSKKKQLVIVVSGLVVLALLASGGLLYSWRSRSNTVADPFNAKLLAATNFALFYPTDLPGGYAIDKKSVNIPHPGVVVFDLKGPRGSRSIYISQEARPSTFNFGGYYNNFTQLHKEIASRGTIATGYINDRQTAIGSLVIGNTWVLTNTTSRGLTPSDLAALLKSLELSQ